MELRGSAVEIEDRAEREVRLFEDLLFQNLDAPEIAQPFVNVKVVETETGFEESFRAALLLHAGQRIPAERQHLFFGFQSLANQICPGSPTQAGANRQRVQEQSQRAL